MATHGNELAIGVHACDKQAFQVLMARCVDNALIQ
jgi:hypothetical protein